MRLAVSSLAVVLSMTMVVLSGGAAAAPTAGVDALGPRSPIQESVVEPVNRPEPVKNDKPAPVQWSCKDKLAQRLHAAGFRGKNLRQAWAIAMRESGGNPRSISSTGDYGVFQFNRAAHSSQPWWDSRKLLTPKYNIKVAYRVSKGGKTWYMWDIAGDGDHLGRYTSQGIYSKYEDWYEKYPCDSI